MSILNYFWKKDGRPAIESERLTLAANLSVNRNVCAAMDKSVSRKRGNYFHYSPSDKVRIGRDALNNGIAKAVRKYTADLGHPVNESTVRTFKKYYQQCLKDGNVAPEQALGEQLSNAPAPPKRGRKTLLGDMEDDLIDCLKSLRTTGGIVNSSIVVAMATGIVECKCPERLAKNGGDLNLKKDWANKLITRLGWSKRRATTSKGKEPADSISLSITSLGHMRYAQ
jgi:hypothetical protein